MEEHQTQKGERQKTVTLYKNEGETPLECLERFRNENPLYKDAILSYAGRLDPMAEGTLLVLVDEENKNREKYLGLDKSYELEILFGIQSDTGDILGLINSFQQSSFMSTDSSKDNSFFKSFIGTFFQPYPHYSSKPVNGKPLFEWAREGKIGEIEIPTKSVEIYNIELLKTFEMSGEEILASVKERINKVKGDFRQKEIISSWEKVLGSEKNLVCNIVKIRVHCSSGTYMRSLAEEIAKKLGINGLAWKIKRLLFISK